jgi:hypothetical protein
MSCTKMNFVSELTEAYQKTLAFLYNSVLEPFYASACPRKDLTGTEEFISSVEHAVNVNKASIVDMKTLQFNYKLYRVATQKKNLPLPTCKYIIPLAYAYWNRVKPGSDINTQMMWNMNFINPVPSPQCALVKQIGILQPQYTIHRLGQMLSCIQPLDSFYSAIEYRMVIARDQPLWRSTRSIERDLISMARRYNPQHTLRRAGGPVIISNPLGVATYNAVVQTMALLSDGGTPLREPKKWYEDRNNRESVLSVRRRGCVGCMVRPLVKKSTNSTQDKRKWLERRRRRSAARKRPMPIAPSAITTSTMYRSFFPGERRS